MNGKKIKVLHFMSSGKIGGQGRALYQLFKALKDDKDIELSAAAGRDEGLYAVKLNELGIPIIRLGIKSGFSLNFKKTIIEQFKTFDIHHLHDASPNQMIYSLLAGSRVKRCFTRRGGLFHYPKWNIKKNLKFRIKRILLKKFDGYSANSMNAAASMKQQYNVKKEVKLLYNGIDFKLLAPKARKDNILKSLGLMDRFIIGTASRLVKLKRTDLLIRAFSRAAIPNKKLLILGKGVELENLKSWVHQLNLEKQVVFAGEVANMADYYQVLDCFVLPSTNAESFGNAVVEAMYFKIPAIIMEDSGGLREHIEDGHTGFTARDEIDLTRKIEYIYNHSHEAKKIASRASEYVEKKYSISKMVDSYKTFYREILGMDNHGKSK
jgi:glycosyltransferase involved in cell wall biosynthesis